MILLFLLRESMGNFSYANSMLMISYLVLLTNLSMMHFAKLMTDEFEMSMMGELEFFLGFEVKQLEEWHVHQSS